MTVPGVEQVGERPLEELVQNASQQAVAVAREQLDTLRLELTARAGRAGPGLALVGGGAFLAALASGTGTASLVLLLARRPGPSAAAFGVTAAYAGASAFLAREGLVRLRESAVPSPDTATDDEPAKKTATKPAQRAKASAKSRPKSPTPRRRASGTQTKRRRGQP
jgi:putative superfamily III holin-X